jgi:hypothetical protein
MGRLCTNSDDCRGVVGDVFIVEGEADGTYKCGVAMFCFVLGGFREDSRERMDAFQLIIGNDHEKRKNTLSDGKQVVIGWFPFERGKGVVCLFEEAGDGVRRHVEIVGRVRFHRLVLILTLVSIGRGRRIRLASKIPFYLL